jgi:membrane-bound metal-dependent hydrolase YbcI (DUF457 family)
MGIKLMTIFGHASVSYVAARITPKTLIPACVIGGIIPDIDFMFILFPFFNEIHRVVSHNIFFVMIAAVVICLFFPKQRGRAWLCACAGGMLHLLVDSMLDQNPTNGLGVALFWPLSNTMFCPINLVSIDHHSEGWSNLWRSLKIMWVVAIYELPFYAIAGYLWYCHKPSPNDIPLKNEIFEPVVSGD